MTTDNRFQIFPQGISVGPARYRPVMIFRDRTENEAVPVWLDPVDAGLLLAESNVVTRSHGAHRATLKLFEGLGVQLTSVYLNELAGTTQYATLTAVQGKKAVSVRVRAAEVMSLAVNAGCLFFTNQDFVEKSRSLNMEWMLHGSLGTGVDRRFEEIH